MSKFDKMLAAAPKPSVDVEVMNADASANFKPMNLRLDQVVPSSTNSTFNPDQVEPLSESLAKDDQVQPILVRKVSDDPNDPYVIIDGETRWRAMSHLHELDPDDSRFKTIRAEVVVCTTARAKAMQLVANLMRKTLTTEQVNQHYAQLGREVPLLRAENPEKYYGMSHDAIIADQINQLDPDANAKASTVRFHREQAEAKEKLAESRTLAPKWAERGEREKIKPRVLVKISERPEAEQLQLFDAYEKEAEQRGGKAKEWLELETSLFNERDAASVAKKAISATVRELAKLERVKEKGYAIDEKKAAELKAAINELLGEAPGQSE